MFNRLKKIFAKEKKTEKISMDYERLKHYFYESIQSRERTDIIEARIARDNILSIAKDLLVVMDNLKNKEIPEKRAKSSELVKNRFSEKSIATFNNMFEIEKINISGYGDIGELARTAKKHVDRIDLSPKEVMHIKFFFSEEFSDVARLMSIIYKNIEKMESIISGDFAKKKNNIEKCISSIASYENSIAQGSDQLKDLSNELNSLEKKKDSISLISLDEYRDTRSSIKHLDTRMSYLRQQISSVLGSMSRILKRAYHNKEDALISEYIQSPYDAFMQDRENKIRNVLIKTLVMTKDNELDIDKKSILKLEETLDKLDELNQCRNEIDELDKRMSELSNKEGMLSEKEDLNKNAEKEIRSTEKKIDLARAREQDIKQMIEDAKQQITENKKKTASLISDLAGKEIELSEQG
ncbi:MAG: hypothetical protein HZB65_02380 [Candidatus Aenigmarchaeota archaeon]|nr:hypothetical protein [Candidatus Aenigmarchaeota archaeon]